MRNFYIDGNKVFTFSEKKNGLVCLGELLGETADYLFCSSINYSHVMFSYNKKVHVGGYSMCCPQEYETIKKALAKYTKPFQSVLRPITEFHTQV